MEVLQQDPFTGGVELLEYCLKKLDLTYDDFEKIMNMPAKSFQGYNCYYTLVKSLKRPITWENKINIVPDTLYKKYFSFNV